MNNIAKARKELGVSQAKLARILGWGASRIANYELGIRTPSLHDCRLIVMAFKKQGLAYSLDDLFPVGNSHASEPKHTDA
ncbi:helix-turn-helix transcriptional regulator [Morganella morganii]|uniref:Transcriptional regulator n=1 Tax=Morganella morganii TaxID=582 RepID=A0AAU8ZGX9_MORMO|nr:helix-turn-helix transcriptional regulator [Morganella morganii]AWC92343.1 transcriptional regulator [Morganella morganii]HAT3624539.1 helix-turn-helix transcriptional regulator [Morganella morganii]